MVTGVVEIKPCNRPRDDVWYPDQIGVPFFRAGSRRGKRKRNVSLHDIDQRDLKPVPDEVVAEFIRPITVGQPAKARESGFSAEQATDIAAEQGNDERFAENSDL